MSTKPLALFLDRASVYPDDLDFSLLEGVAQWLWFDNAGTDEFMHAVEEAEIIVSNKVVINRDVIEHSRQLRLICVAATGYNNIDIEAAHQHGITVCNVRAYATASVVQHVFALVLSLNRKLPSYHKSVIEGDWSRSEFFCYFGDTISELEGKVLGIVGYGELGRAVARVAECFGMKVVLARRDETDSRPGRVALSTMLSMADVVSLHCPLTESNYHMIAEKEMAIMKPNAILINAARGGLVDENALLTALQTNQIGAAGLDVLAEEPPSPDNPLINYRADNLIITPHVAWASQQSRQKLINEIAENIKAYLQGQSRNAV
jgi:glycerate dehydrogenase